MLGRAAGPSEAQLGCGMEMPGVEEDAMRETANGGDGRRTSSSEVGVTSVPWNQLGLSLHRLRPQITSFPWWLEAGGDKSLSSEVPDQGCRRPGVAWEKGHSKVAEVNFC